MTYLVWKLLHIASVIVFLGNITTGIFWAAHAHKTRDFALIGSTFEGIIKSDRYFTTPGVTGIAITGTVAALTAKLPILGTGWILWPIILFVISGAAFGMRVAPLQRRIIGLARDADTAGRAWGDYAHAYDQWKFWGLIAVLAPAAAFVIMVLKPGIPAF
jgi:uncharacterized membrane protein